MDDKKSFSLDNKNIKELEQEKLLFQELYKHLTEHEKFSKKIFDTDALKSII